MLNNVILGDSVLVTRLVSNISVYNVDRAFGIDYYTEKCLASIYQSAELLKSTC